MNTGQIFADRLQKIEALSLSSGNHEDFKKGMCVMEAVAYVAGEPWSDHPACACPVITSFMISWNDNLPTDADRDRLLKPIVPRLVGTKSTAQIEEKRSYMALDWLVRVHTPTWLDLVADLAPHAKTLRDLDEITDMASAIAAGKLTNAAGAAAGVAAWDAAWAAAGAAAGDAAGAAAGDAAWAAAGVAAGAAAGAAAGDAAWAAARAAAGAAAWAAARAAAGAAARAAAGAAAGVADKAFLKPTVLLLQESALDLLNRMIEVRS